MHRRDFLALGGYGASVLMLSSGFGRVIAAEQLTDSIALELKKGLADTALQAAREGGATYCDVRVARYVRQTVMTREDKVENIANGESTGIGVRVIVAGAWGFAATNDLSVQGASRCARDATAIAKANAKYISNPVVLAAAPNLGTQQWRTPLQKNGMAVPVKEKVDLLLGINADAINAGADFMNSALYLVNEQKYFASTDGSYIDQDVHRIWLPFTATAVDKASGKYRTRDGLSAPMGMGYEYLDAVASDRIELPGGVIAYGASYDARADAVAAAKQARLKLKSPSVKPGKYDLVIDPTNLFLTIHESVGHPLELDRVLGYEANYAGTSFATLNKREEGFRYGSDQVTIFADRTQKGSLGAVGYDDEGIKAGRWTLIDQGKLVDYQATRDQMHVLGQEQAHGCSYADSWSSVQFQRMPNVSLAPGKTPLSVQEMVKGVENGIYIHGRGSYSIDQQRYNAQFGGQLFYEIRNGEVGRQIEDVAYQLRTPDFWGSCAGVCDERDYRLGGSFFDGKGQPGQVSSVSHGSSTARFNDISVLSTARSLG